MYLGTFEILEGNALRRYDWRIYEQPRRANSQNQDDEEDGSKTLLEGEAKRGHWPGPPGTNTCDFFDDRGKRQTGMTCGRLTHLKHENAQSVNDLGCVLDAIEKEAESDPESSLF